MSSGKSPFAKLNRMGAEKNKKRLISSVSRAENVDDITKGELLAMARRSGSGRTRKKVKGLLEQAQNGTNATYNDRSRLQESSELLADRPGRKGLLGF